MMIVTKMTVGVFLILWTALIGAGNASHGVDELPYDIRLPNGHLNIRDIPKRDLVRELFAETCVSPGGHQTYKGALEDTDLDAIEHDEWQITHMHGRRLGFFSIAGHSFDPQSYDEINNSGSAYRVVYALHLELLRKKAREHACVTAPTIDSDESKA